ncbi:Isopentenyldiphosphate isomerase [Pseudomonas syringae pv. actinidiae]|uniref:Isopentenyldiphosphate isomerase n=1 Tax=Pseudomonas syringae pv. actinidiae TaxID=103796 RepID=A0A2V0QQ85_PSESF|nr:Isopentenyldiphosphate isomerase [Pseudomonas syringae pv. actinidiae]
MIFQNAIVLLLDDRYHGRGNTLLMRLLKRLAIGFLGNVFATLCFFQYSQIIVAGECGFQLDPCLVQISRYAGRIFWLAAQLLYMLLELSNCCAYFRRTACEKSFHRWGLRIFCAGLEPFFTVDAGFNQVIQDRDRFFIDISHLIIS